jgi:hypothetical protein
MNIKEASAMLNQIKKSGLHTKTKIAQELVRELEMTLKSAGMTKQADLRLYTQSDSDLKKIFFYWASAALSEMTSEPELQGMTIPPVGSDTPTEYGTKIFNQLGGGRMRRRQASVARYAIFLNNLYEQIKPTLTKSVNITYKSFVRNNKEFERLNSDILEDLWQRATLWAVTGTRDSAIRDTEVSPWKRIEGNVEGGGSLAERVMKAIRKGVFSAMTSKGRYLNLEERRLLGIATVDGRKVRQESIEGQSSSGGEYSKLDQQGQVTELKTKGEGYLEESGWSEDQLEGMTGKLTDGSLNNVETLMAIKILLNSDHIANDDAFIRELKLDFMAGVYTEKKEMLLASEILKMTGNPITDELMELIRSYHSGELDEADRLDAEYDLINDGWMVDHIEMSTDATESVKMISEQAEQMAQIAVSGLNLPEGDLGDAIAELAKAEMQEAHLKKLSKMFDSDQFHWMLDANLYLQDSEWALATRYFNEKAMSSLQDMIEEHQEPLIPVGLKNVLNSSTFTDKAKIVAIKEFTDSCMENSKKLFGKDQGPFSWYLECAIVLDGGKLTFKAGEKRKELNIDKLEYFFITGRFIGGIYEALAVMDESEKKDLADKIDSLVSPLIPEGIQVTGKSWLETIGRQKNKKEAYKTAKGRDSAKMKAFFGSVASEIVRYRFYLDLGLTESTGPLVPKNLGNSECDTRVRYLMGPIPTKAVNEVKNDTYDAMLNDWALEVQKALEERVKVQFDKKNTMNNQVKKLFKKLEVGEETDLYKAFVGAS